MVTIQKIRYIRVFTFLLAFISTSLVRAQLSTYTFETASNLMKKDPKPLIVFIHTDWCTYCHKMKQYTFKDKEVLKRINTYYYFISLNAESKEPIRFRNHTFTHIPNGATSGVHELAIALGKINGELSYPTLAILNAEYEIIFQYNSYLSPSELTSTLQILSKSK